MYQNVKIILLLEKAIHGDVLNAIPNIGLKQLANVKIQVYLDV